MFSLAAEQSTNLQNEFPTGEGTVQAVLTPGFEWQVRIHGIYWKARASITGQTFSTGDPVKPVAREGLTLFIELSSGTLA